MRQTVTFPEDVGQSDSGILVFGFDRVRITSQSTASDQLKRLAFDATPQTDATRCELFALELAQFQSYIVTSQGNQHSFLQPITVTAEVKSMLVPSDVEASQHFFVVLNTPAIEFISNNHILRMFRKWSDQMTELGTPDQDDALTQSVIFTAPSQPVSQSSANILVVVNMKSIALQLFDDVGVSVEGNYSISLQLSELETRYSRTEVGSQMSFHGSSLRMVDLKQPLDSPFRMLACTVGSNPSALQKQFVSMSYRNVLRECNVTFETPLSSRPFDLLSDVSFDNQILDNPEMSSKSLEFDFDELYLQWYFFMFVWLCLVSGPFILLWQESSIMERAFCIC
jgi:hypothetical protein